MDRDLQSFLGDLHVRDDQPDALALLIGRQRLLQRTELPEGRQHTLLVRGVPLDLIDCHLDLGGRGLEAGAPLPELGQPLLEKDLTLKAVASHAVE